MMPPFLNKSAACGLVAVSTNLFPSEGLGGEAEVNHKIDPYDTAWKKLAFTGRV